jgi:hypothetical protein
MSSAKQPGPDQLKPNDFPLEADKDTVKRQDGKPVAQSDSSSMAKDITERLNCDEHRREEDRWSA